MTTVDDRNRGIMTTTEPRPAGRLLTLLDSPGRLYAGTCLPIVGTLLQWSVGGVHISYPTVVLPLFVVTSAVGMVALTPWTRPSDRLKIAFAALYMLLGSLLMPLTQGTLAAGFPFIAAISAGVNLASRRAAVVIATSGALLTAAATWLIGSQTAIPTPLPWWLTPTVGLPVLIGISRRDRHAAQRSARLAVEEAHRAMASEAREAALLERGRIAREIHDVLGHSLSAVAMQLDLADALCEAGREREATAAVRKARALAVDSIAETRRAVHALREDARPLPDTLRQLADHHATEFTFTGQPAPVGVETTHAMVRVAQEALTNAAKYAPGARRTLGLAFAGDRVTLTVRNGPATRAPRADLAGGTGIGLVGMRERAALLGGTLRAGPTTDGGWTVAMGLPR